MHHDPVDTNTCIYIINAKPPAELALGAPWHPIGSLDTMIAAHALCQQALLVSNNTREFAKVPGLQLDNWFAAP